jgi:hypothetical protein
MVRFNLLSEANLAPTLHVRCSLTPLPSHFTIQNIMETVDCGYMAFCSTLTNDMMDIHENRVYLTTTNSIFESVEFFTG